LRIALVLAGRSAALPTPIHSPPASIHAFIQPAGVQAEGRAPSCSILYGNMDNSMPAESKPSLAASSFSEAMRRTSDWCQGDSTPDEWENASMRATITLAEAEPVALSKEAAARAWRRCDIDDSGMDGGTQSVRVAG